MPVDKTSMAFPLSAPPSLVIFDCDGVLVDTETVANHLLVRLLAEDGLHITYEESRRLFLGKTLEAVQAHAEAVIGHPLRADWPDHVRDETIKAFAQGVAAIPHVHDVLVALKAHGIPYCVASSGKFTKMRFTLGSSGLLPLVDDVLFSFEQVGRGKPWPDLFLFAAKSMGYAPVDCVVIEDSVPGIQAAVAAGMPVLGFAGDPHTDAEALRSAGAHVFRDLRDVLGLLGALKRPSPNPLPTGEG